MKFTLNIYYTIYYRLPLYQLPSYYIRKKNFLEFNTFMERESSVKFARGCSDKQIWIYRSDSRQLEAILGHPHR